MRLIEGYLNIWTGTSETLANSADPDQTPQNAASDQDLHVCANYRKLRVKWNSPRSRPFSQPTVRDNRPISAFSALIFALQCVLSVLICLLFPLLCDYVSPSTFFFFFLHIIFVCVCVCVFFHIIYQCREKPPVFYRLSWMPRPPRDFGTA